MTGNRVEMPFDRILYKDKAGASQRSLSTEQFLEISLHERMRAILEERVQFLSGLEPVATRLALRALYQAKI